MKRTQQRYIAVNNRVHHTGEPQLLGVVRELDHCRDYAYVKWDDGLTDWCDAGRLEWVHGPLLPTGMVQRGW